MCRARRIERIRVRCVMRTILTEAIGIYVVKVREMNRLFSRMARSTHGPRELHPVCINQVATCVRDDANVTTAHALCASLCACQETRA